MVRRLSVLAATLAFIGLTVPSHAQAQGSLYLQGGATFPTSDYGEFVIENVALNVGADP